MNLFPDTVAVVTSMLTAAEEASVGVMVSFLPETAVAASLNVISSVVDVSTPVALAAGASNVTVGGYVSWVIVSNVLIVGFEIVCIEGGVVGHFI